MCWLPYTGRFLCPVHWGSNSVYELYRYINRCTIPTLLLFQKVKSYICIGIYLHGLSFCVYIGTYDRDMQAVRTYSRLCLSFGWRKISGRSMIATPRFNYPGTSDAFVSQRCFLPYLYLYRKTEQANLVDAL